MKAFMDKDFMLQSATAQHLYHDYAAGMPIVLRLSRPGAATRKAGSTDPPPCC